MKRFLKTTAALSVAGLTALTPAFAGINDWYPERDEIISLSLRKHRPGEGKKGAHRRLLRAMEAAGLTVELNAAICQEPLPEELKGYTRSTWASIYYSQERRVVICQENYRTEVNERLGHGPNPEWTDKDYFALRVEAQHLLQDCRAAEPFDGVMAISSTEGLAPAFRTLVNSPARGEWGFLDSYGRRIMSTEQLNLQREAYGLASYNKPGKQRKQIEKFCPIYEL